MYAPPAAETAAWRDRVGSGFFLFVGAGRYYKGLPFLMEAARRTGLPVVVAGGGTEAGSVPPSVTMLGGVSDAAREALLDLCGAFVFPSHLRSEAFGIALAEAARAGRPMISCEIGTGTSFVNAGGETGLVVPPADPEALAGAMRRLDADPGLRARMGAAARQRFERLFRAETMCGLSRSLVAAPRSGVARKGLRRRHLPRPCGCATPARGSNLGGSVRPMHALVSTVKHLLR